MPTTEENILQELVKRMHWKIQLCAHANLGGKLCNYFVQVTSNTVENCVNLLESTVELYLF